MIIRSNIQIHTINSLKYKKAIHQINKNNNKVILQVYKVNDQLGKIETNQTNNNNNKNKVTFIKFKVKNR